MKKKDHLALGRFLLKMSDNEELHKHWRAFLLGCVEPDYNIATYTRGMRHHRKFRGHNAENSLAHLEKCLVNLQENNLHSTWDFFTLGTSLHYVADSFTLPHNGFWGGSLAEHVAYEAGLHKEISFELMRARFNVSEKNDSDSWAGSDDFRSLRDFFEKCHQDYLRDGRSMKIDCQYIIRVCEAVLDECLSSRPVMHPAVCGA